jgi:hypothetical protein
VNEAIEPKYRVQYSGAGSRGEWEELSSCDESNTEQGAWVIATTRARRLGVPIANYRVVRGTLEGPIGHREVNECDPPVTTTKPANPKQAYGDKKLPVHTVPPALLLGAAKAFGEGAAKYGAFNWRLSKVEAMTYVGAIQRHLAAYVDGEDVDPESVTGKLHLEGIAACVGILLDCHHGGYLIDNRPPKGPAPQMVLTPKESK